MKQVLKIIAIVGLLLLSGHCLVAQDGPAEPQAPVVSEGQFSGPQPSFIDHIKDDLIEQEGFPPTWDTGQIIYPS